MKSNFGAFLFAHFIQWKSEVQVNFTITSPIYKYTVFKRQIMSKIEQIEKRDSQKQQHFVSRQFAAFFCHTGLETGNT